MDEIPQTQGKVICTHCRQLDYMDHILLRCEIPGQRLIWSLTEDLLWEKKAGWSQGQSIAKIMGTIITPVETNEGRADPGTLRLQRIIKLNHLP